MKRIVRRVQSLNERAAELTAAAGQLPQRVSELREAMTATTGQLQHLKTGLQLNVADLQVSREDDLSAALAEVAAHAPVFAEAGFILDGIDLELSPVQRLIVQLVRHDDVDTLAIQALVQRHQHEKSVRSILSAILKARAMIETIRIDGLDYHKLTIGIGPVPTIRLCWRDSTTDAGPPPSRPNTSAQQQAPAITGTSSFFGPTPGFTSIAGMEQAAAMPGATDTAVQDDAQNDEPAIPAAANAPTPQPIPEEGTASPTPSVTTSHPASHVPSTTPPPLPEKPDDPLARFKVMPQLQRPS